MTQSFACPYCGGPTKVTDSRPGADSRSIRRRRGCGRCQRRVTTIEAQREGLSLDEKLALRRDRAELRELAVELRAALDATSAALQRLASYQKRILEENNSD